jgi:hypothetical protein
MAVRVPPAIGDRWRFNIVRVDRRSNGEIASVTSWNRIGMGDFHALDRMLTAVFADAGGSIAQPSPQAASAGSQAPAASAGSQAPPASAGSQAPAASAGSQAPPPASSPAGSAAPAAGSAAPGSSGFRAPRSAGSSGR